MTGHKVETENITKLGLKAADLLIVDGQIKLLSSILDPNNPVNHEAIFPVGVFSETTVKAGGNTYTYISEITLDNAAGNLVDSAEVKGQVTTLVSSGVYNDSDEGNIITVIGENTFTMADGGNDTIIIESDKSGAKGDAGDDTIIVHGDNTFVQGNEGKDTFKVDIASKNTTINDFEAGETFQILLGNSDQANVFDYSITFENISVPRSKIYIYDKPDTGTNDLDEAFLTAKAAGASFIADTTPISDTETLYLITQNPALNKQYFFKNNGLTNLLKPDQLGGLTADDLLIVNGQVTLRSSLVSKYDAEITDFDAAVAAAKGNGAHFIADTSKDPQTLYLISDDYSTNPTYKTFASFNNKGLENLLNSETSVNINGVEHSYFPGFTLNNAAGDLIASNSALKDAPNVRLGNDGANKFIISNEVLSNPVDLIEARGGNDSITVLGAGVTASGGDGDDNITLHGSDSRATGGAGNDNIALKNDDSHATGGAGDDNITLSGYNSRAAGGDGDDTITVTNTNADVYGNSGTDTFIADIASKNTRVADFKTGETFQIKIDNVDQLDGLTAEDILVVDGQATLRNSAVYKYDGSDTAVTTLEGAVAAAGDAGAHFIADTSNDPHALYLISPKSDGSFTYKYVAAFYNDGLTNLLASETSVEAGANTYTYFSGFTITGPAADSLIADSTIDLLDGYRTEDMNADSYTLNLPVDKLEAAETITVTVPNNANLNDLYIGKVIAISGPAEGTDTDSKTYTLDISSLTPEDLKSLTSNYNNVTAIIGIHGEKDSSEDIPISIELLDGDGKTIFSDSDTLTVIPHADFSSTQGSAKDIYGDENSDSLYPINQDFFEGIADNEYVKITTDSTLSLGDAGAALKSYTDSESEEQYYILTPEQLSNDDFNLLSASKEQLTLQVIDVDHELRSDFNQALQTSTDPVGSIPTETFAADFGTSYILSEIKLDEAQIIIDKDSLPAEATTLNIIYNTVDQHFVPLSDLKGTADGDYIIPIPTALAKAGQSIQLFVEARDGAEYYSSTLGHAKNYVLNVIGDPATVTTTPVDTTSVDMPADPLVDTSVDTLEPTLVDTPIEPEPTPSFTLKPNPSDDADGTVVIAGLPQDATVKLGDETIAFEEGKIRLTNEQLAANPELEIYLAPTTDLRQNIVVIYSKNTGGETIEDSTHEYTLFTQGSVFALLESLPATERSHVQPSIQIADLYGKDLSDAQITFTFDAGINLSTSIKNAAGDVVISDPDPDGTSFTFTSNNLSGDSNSLIFKLTDYIEANGTTDFPYNLVIKDSDGNELLNSGPQEYAVIPELNAQINEDSTMNIINDQVSIDGDEVTIEFTTPGLDSSSDETDIEFSVVLFELPNSVTAINTYLNDYKFTNKTSAKSLEMVKIDSNVDGTSDRVGIQVMPGDTISVSMPRDVYHSDTNLLSQPSKMIIADLDDDHVSTDPVILIENILENNELKSANDSVDLNITLPDLPVQTPDALTVDLVEGAEMIFTIPDIEVGNGTIFIQAPIDSNTQLDFGYINDSAEFIVINSTEKTGPDGSPGYLITRPIYINDVPFAYRLSQLDTTNKTSSEDLTVKIDIYDVNGENFHHAISQEINVAVSPTASNLEVSSPDGIIESTLADGFKVNLTPYEATQNEYVIIQTAADNVVQLIGKTGVGDSPLIELAAPGTDDKQYLLKPEQLAKIAAGELELNTSTPAKVSLQTLDVDMEQRTEFETVLATSTPPDLTEILEDFTHKSGGVNTATAASELSDTTPKGFWETVTNNIQHLFGGGKELEDELTDFATSSEQSAANYLEEFNAYKSEKDSVTTSPIESKPNTQTLTTGVEGHDATLSVVKGGYGLADLYYNIAGFTDDNSTYQITVADDVEVMILKDGDYTKVDDPSTHNFTAGQIANLRLDFTNVITETVMPMGSTETSIPTESNVLSITSTMNEPGLDQQVITSTVTLETMDRLTDDSVAIGDGISTTVTAPTDTTSPTADLSYSVGNNKLVLKVVLENMPNPGNLADGLDFTIMGLPSKPAGMDEANLTQLDDGSWQINNFTAEELEYGIEIPYHGIVRADDLHIVIKNFSSSDPLYAEFTVNNLYKDLAPGEASLGMGRISHDINGSMQATFIESEYSGSFSATAATSVLEQVATQAGGLEAQLTTLYEDIPGLTNEHLGEFLSKLDGLLDGSEASVAKGFADYGETLTLTGLNLELGTNVNAEKQAADPLNIVEFGLPPFLQPDEIVVGRIIAGSGDETALNISNLTEDRSSFTLTDGSSISGTNIETGDPMLAFLGSGVFSQLGTIDTSDATFTGVNIQAEMTLGMKLIIESPDGTIKTVTATYEVGVDGTLVPNWNTVDTTSLTTQEFRSLVNALTDQGHSRDTITELATMKGLEGIDLGSALVMADHVGGVEFPIGDYHVMMRGESTVTKTTETHDKPTDADLSGNWYDSFLRVSEGKAISYNMDEVYTFNPTDGSPRIAFQIFTEFDMKSQELPEHPIVAEIIKLQGSDLIVETITMNDGETASVTTSFIGGEGAPQDALFKISDVSIDSATFLYDPDGSGNLVEVPDDLLTTGLDVEQIATLQIKIPDLAADASADFSVTAYYPSANGKLQAQKPDLVTIEITNDELAGDVVVEEDTDYSGTVPIPHEDNELGDNTMSNSTTTDFMLPGFTVPSQEQAGKLGFMVTFEITSGSISLGPEIKDGNTITINGIEFTSSKNVTETGNLSSITLETAFSKLPDTETTIDPIQVSGQILVGNTFSFSQKVLDDNTTEIHDATVTLLDNDAPLTTVSRIVEDQPIELTLLTTPKYVVQNSLINTVAQDGVTTAYNAGQTTLDPDNPTMLKTTIQGAKDSSEAMDMTVVVKTSPANDLEAVSESAVHIHSDVQAAIDIDVADTNHLIKLDETNEGAIINVPLTGTTIPVGESAADIDYIILAFHFDSDGNPIGLPEGVEIDTVLSYPPQGILQSIIAGGGDASTNTPALYYFVKPGEVTIDGEQHLTFPVRLTKDLSEPLSINNFDYILTDGNDQYQKDLVDKYNSVFDRDVTNIDAMLDDIITVVNSKMSESDQFSSLDDIFNAAYNSDTPTEIIKIIESYAEFIMTPALGFLNKVSPENSTFADGNFSQSNVTLMPADTETTAADTTVTDTTAADTTDQTTTNPDAVKFALPGFVIPTQAMLSDANSGFDNSKFTVSYDGAGDDFSDYSVTDADGKTVNFADLLDPTSDTDSQITISGIKFNIIVTYDNIAGTDDMEVDGISLVADSSALPMNDSVTINHFIMSSTTSTLDLDLQQQVYYYYHNDTDTSETGNSSHSENHKSELISFQNIDVIKTEGNPAITIVSSAYEDQEPSIEFLTADGQVIADSNIRVTDYDQGSLHIKDISGEAPTKLSLQELKDMASTNTHSNEDIQATFEVTLADDSVITVSNTIEVLPTIDDDLSLGSVNADQTITLTDGEQLIKVPLTGVSYLDIDDVDGVILNFALKDDGKPDGIPDGVTIKGMIMADVDDEAGLPDNSITYIVKPELDDAGAPQIPLVIADDFSGDSITLSGFTVGAVDMDTEMSEQFLSSMNQILHGEDEPNYETDLFEAVSSVFADPKLIEAMDTHEADGLENFSKLHIAMKMGEPGASNITVKLIPSTDTPLPPKVGEFGVSQNVSVSEPEVVVDLAKLITDLNTSDSETNEISLTAPYGYVFAQKAMDSDGIEHIDATTFSSGLKTFDNIDALGGWFITPADDIARQTASGDIEIAYKINSEEAGIKATNEGSVTVTVNSVNQFGLIMADQSMAEYAESDTINLGLQATAFDSEEILSTINIFVSNKTTDGSPPLTAIEGAQLDISHASITNKDLTDGAKNNYKDVYSQLAEDNSDLNIQWVYQGIEKYNFSYNDKDYNISVAQFVITQTNDTVSEVFMVEIGSSGHPIDAQTLADSGLLDSIGLSGLKFTDNQNISLGVSSQVNDSGDLLDPVPVGVTTINLIEAAADPVIPVNVGTDPVSSANLAAGTDLTAEEGAWVPLEDVVDFSNLKVGEVAIITVPNGVELSFKNDDLQARDDILVNDDGTTTYRMTESGIKFPGYMLKVPYELTSDQLQLEARSFDATTKTELSSLSIEELINRADDVDDQSVVGSETITADINLTAVINTAMTATTDFRDAEINIQELGVEVDNTLDVPIYFTAGMDNANESVEEVSIKVASGTNDSFQINDDITTPKTLAQGTDGVLRFSDGTLPSGEDLAHLEVISNDETDITLEIKAVSITDNGVTRVLTEAEIDTHNLHKTIEIDVTAKTITESPIISGVGRPTENPPIQPEPAATDPVEVVPIRPELGPETTAGNVVVDYDRQKLLDDDGNPVRADNGDFIYLTTDGEELPTLDSNQNEIMVMLVEASDDAVLDEDINNDLIADATYEVTEVTDGAGNKFYKYTFTSDPGKRIDIDNAKFFVSKDSVEVEGHQIDFQVGIVAVTKDSGGRIIGRSDFKMYNEQITFGDTLHSTIHTVQEISEDVPFFAIGINSNGDSDELLAALEITDLTAGATMSIELADGSGMITDLDAISIVRNDAGEYQLTTDTGPVLVNYESLIIHPQPNSNENITYSLKGTFSDANGGEFVIEDDVATEVLSQVDAPIFNLVTAATEGQFVSLENLLGLTDTDGSEYIKHVKMELLNDVEIDFYIANGDGSYMLLQDFTNSGFDEEITINHEAGEYNFNNISFDNIFVGGRYDPATKTHSHFDRAIQLETTVTVADVDADTMDDQDNPVETVGVPVTQVVTLEFNPVLDTIISVESGGGSVGEAVDLGIDIGWRAGELDENEVVDSITLTFNTDLAGTDGTLPPLLDGDGNPLDPTIYHVQATNSPSETSYTIRTNDNDNLNDNGNHAELIESLQIIPTEAGTLSVDVTINGYHEGVDVNRDSNGNVSIGNEGFSTTVNTTIDVTAETTSFAGSLGADSSNGFDATTGPGGGSEFDLMGDLLGGAVKEADSTQDNGITSSINSGLVSKEELDIIDFDPGQAEELIHSSNDVDPPAPENPELDTTIDPQQDEQALS